MSVQINCNFCKEQNMKKFQIITMILLTSRHSFHICEGCQIEYGLPLEEKQAHTILDELMEQLVEEVTERMQEG